MNLTKPTKPFTEPRNNKSESRIAIEAVLEEHTPRGGITIPRIAELTGFDPSTVRKSISALRDLHQITNTGTPKSPVYVVATKQLPVKAQPIRYVSRETYNGIELRPFDGRPGAMTAYSLPSLRDGVLVPYNGIRPQLVGALKDQQNNAR